LPLGDFDRVFLREKNCSSSLSSVVEGVRVFFGPPQVTHGSRFSENLEQKRMAQLRTKCALALFLRRESQKADALLVATRLRSSLVPEGASTLRVLTFSSYLQIVRHAHVCVMKLVRFFFVTWHRNALLGR